MVMVSQSSFIPVTTFHVSGAKGDGGSTGSGSSDRVSEESTEAMGSTAFSDVSCCSRRDYIARRNRRTDNPLQTEGNDNEDDSREKTSVSKDSGIRDSAIKEHDRSFRSNGISELAQRRGLCISPS